MSTQRECKSDGVGCTALECVWPLQPCAHEAYVTGLERRIKEQRDQLTALGDLRDGPQREAKRRIAYLQRMLGEKTEKLARQYDGLRALKAEIERLKA